MESNDFRNFRKKEGNPEPEEKPKDVIIFQNRVYYNPFLQEQAEKAAKGNFYF